MNDPAGEDRSAARFADLFDNAPVAYVTTDEHGLITEANAEFQRLVGRSGTELVGRRSLASVLSVAGRIFLETHLLPMLEHDEAVREVDLDLLRRDGRRVPVLLSANATPAGGSSMRAVLMELRDRHRYERDLLEATHSAEEARAAATTLAQTLQQTLIPPAPPDIPHLTVAAAYRPAGDGSTVGGDFYDVFQTGPDTWVIVLGDVSGKGVGAATVTSFIRYTARALAIGHDDPSVLLHHLDQAMHAERTDHFCTMVAVRLTRGPRQWSMELSLAGHPPALVRHRDGTVEELGTYGSALGLMRNAVFHTVSCALTDETVTLYTDGVTEARAEGELYGQDRLVRLLADADHDPAWITDAITQAALEHQRGNASDDIAVVTFAATAAP